LIRVVELLPDDAPDAFRVSLLMTERILVPKMWRSFASDSSSASPVIGFIS
jgi:hypothetical protein